MTTILSAGQSLNAGIVGLGPGGLQGAQNAAQQSTVIAQQPASIYAPQPQTQPISSGGQGSWMLLAGLVVGGGLGFVIGRMTAA